MEMTGIQLDPWGPGRSRVREQLLEHQLLADIVRLMLLQGRRCDVLRAEFDASGHDVVLESDGILRHVQLKAMRADGARAHVNIHTGLAAKLSGCVIWILVDPDTLVPSGYLWLGGRPTQALPPLGQRMAKHSKASAVGVKADRPDLRLVRRSAFEPAPDVEALVVRLFGSPVERDVLRLAAHLRAQPLVPPAAPAWLAHLQAGRFEAMPAEFTDDEFVEFTHLIDGYAVAGIDGPEGAAAYVSETVEAARAGRDVLPSRIWAAMFLEHRRLRFEGRDPSPDEEGALYRLVTLLRDALLALA